MYRVQMPGCCAAAVVQDLYGITKANLQAQITAAKRAYGVLIATTARQPEADRYLKAAGFKMTGSGKSNHGAYEVKVWVKDLKDFKKKKTLAAKKKVAAKK